MKNLILWILTSIFYFTALYHVIEMETAMEIFLWCVLVLILTTPFKYKGSIFTVFGNVDEKKAEYLYAFFSLYQKIDHQEKDGKAVCFFSPLYQKGNVVLSLLGISVYQEASADAGTLFGFTIFKKIENEKEWFTTLIGRK